MFEVRLIDIEEHLYILSKRSIAIPQQAVSYNRHTRLGHHRMTSSEISYTEAQSNLDTLLVGVADSKDIIIIKRDGTDKNVALIAETDLSSLLETVYLLRSPANAARLHRAITSGRLRQRSSQTKRSSRLQPFRAREPITIDR